MPFRLINMKSTKSAGRKQQFEKCSEKKGVFFVDFLHMSLKLQNL